MAAQPETVTAAEGGVAIFFRRRKIKTYHLVVVEIYSDGNVNVGMETKKRKTEPKDILGEEIYGIKVYHLWYSNPEAANASYKNALEAKELARKIKAV